MRLIFALVLAVGLGLAGFAVLMVQRHFQEQEAAIALERAEAAQRSPTVAVVAVTRDMAYGEVLTPEDVMLIDYVETAMPEGTFASLEALFPEDAQGSRSLLRPIYAKEPVLAGKVTAPGASAGIATRLAPGMRAFAISVDATSGVSGFLHPGDQVDVYWTGAIETGIGSREDVTKLIETNLPIVAVDQTAEQSRNEAAVARTVTVEVTPQQVANLAQAQSSGSLSLSLVGMQDDTVAYALEVDQRRLLGLPEPLVAPEPEPQVVTQAAPAPEVCTVRTRRASEVVEVQIPCTD
ncbi:Flp pilus assembly protein CpaB [Pseudoroseicyclus aestuarii]|uniref:Pilus assembly protein CpaB n=1 Tax=Pseudoroseicyclus aestuarii TaxID=1795041 RepID=A0A318SUE6_9RHOB|nr:Flp pilus assembly protein CpaB [Pseudoroseicyclus aestuarii]PYE84985.1 pilus assembly protein CpaB [Pseudoroseicyclus aestuarii]